MRIAKYISLFTITIAVICISLNACADYAIEGKYRCQLYYSVNGKANPAHVSFYEIAKMETPKDSQPNATQIESIKKAIPDFTLVPMYAVTWRDEIQGKPGPAGYSPAFLRGNVMSMYVPAPYLGAASIRIISNNQLEVQWLTGDGKLRGVEVCERMKA